MGLTNVKIMIPFVRTLTEAEGVIRLLGEHGLKRGENGLEVIMMCELPSNAVLADAVPRPLRRLLHRVQRHDPADPRTRPRLRPGRRRFDERDPAVKFMLSAAITACKARGKYVGICGQGPSDHPDLAEWLLEQGIDPCPSTRTPSSTPGFNWPSSPEVGGVATPGA